MHTYDSVDGDCTILLCIIFNRSYIKWVNREIFGVIQYKLYLKKINYLTISGT